MIKIPVTIPAVTYKKTNLVAKLLIIKPHDAKSEPEITILRQSNFSTRYDAIGPVASISPIWVEATMDVVACPVPNASMNSGRNTANE